MDTTHYKQKLEEEKVKLEGEMAGIGRKNPAVPGDWEPMPSETGAAPDVLDQADAFESQDTEKAIFNDLEARYDTVLAALDRIEQGTYGICEVCGGPVEPERLAANPTALTCIKHL